MKTLSYTTNKNLIATLLVAVLILLSGCKKANLLQPTNVDNDLSLRTVNPATEEPSPEAATIFKDASSADLVIGESQTKVGTITITKGGGEMVEIKYTMNGTWRMTSVKLYIGDHTLIPVNSSGIATPSLFPYKQNLTVGGASTATFILHKSLVNGCKSVAANAVVYDAEINSTPEDCWGKGNKISEGDGGMYYGYCINDFRANISLD